MTNIKIIYCTHNMLISMCCGIVHQVSTFRAPDHTITNTRTVSTVDIQKHTIAAGESESWSGVQLYVPPLPPSLLPHCAIIDVNYIVVVSICVWIITLLLYKANQWIIIILNMNTCLVSQRFIYLHMIILVNVYILFQDKIIKLIVYYFIDRGSSCGSCPKAAGTSTDCHWNSSSSQYQPYVCCNSDRCTHRES